MTDFEKQLIGILFRHNCPDVLELGEYEQNLLTDTRRQEISEHLHSCHYCSREIAGLNNYLQQVSSTLEPDLIEQVKDKVQVWIARLIPEGGLKKVTPAINLRGGSQNMQLFEAGGALVSLEVQETGQGRKTILGLLLGLEGEGYQAHLWQAGHQLGSTEVDDLSNFVLADLTPGEYELIVSSPHKEIHVQSVKV